MAYTGFITRIKNLHKHPNADRLQMGECFGNSVIVSMDYTDNQLGVYFPVDGKLSERFCQVNDLVRRKDENGNPAGGYLDPEKRNIKAVKLRGEKSDGLFLPLTSLADFTAISDLREGDVVSSFNDELICEKYIPRSNRRNGSSGISGAKKSRSVNIAPTFKEHIDTPQLAYNLNAFKAGDIVELTLKMHGTSGRTGYLPIHRPAKRTFWEKLLRIQPKDIVSYDYISGTRRSVMDPDATSADGGYYKDNSFRVAMADRIKGKLHEGETLYYEIVGFVNENTPIMASCKNSKIKDKEFSKIYGAETVFSYGCDPLGEYNPQEDVAPRCNIYAYRMTMTNEQGDIVEMSPDQLRARCEQMAINTVPVFTRFMIPLDEDNPGEYVLREVEKYFDGPDPIGKTHVREGVVARIVNRPEIAVYKHKNFSFKVLEGIIKEEAEIPDMEEAEEIVEG